MASGPSEMDSVSRISVVIPVRDGGRYLAQAVGSILSQSYAGFRLHILENCSTDQTPHILATLRDPRVVVHPSDSVLSMEDNWRRIRELDLLEYLTVLGHDDIFYPDFLDEIMTLVRENPTATLYSSHFDIIDEWGRYLRRCRPIPYEESAEEFLRARHQHHRDSYGTGYVMRSRDFRSVDGFPRLPGLIYSDDLLWFRIASLGGKVCSPRTMFAYRQRGTSVSRSVDLEGLYMASKGYLEALLQERYAKDERNSALARRFVERSYRGRIRWILVDLLRSGDGKAIRDFQNSLRAIIAQARSDTLFSPADTITSLAAMLLAVPLPTRARTALATLFVWLAAVPQSRRVTTRGAGRSARDQES